MSLFLRSHNYFFVTLPLALLMVVSQEAEPHVDLVLFKTVLLEYRHGKVQSFTSCASTFPTYVASILSTAFTTFFQTSLTHPEHTQMHIPCCQDVTSLHVNA